MPFRPTRIIRRDGQTLFASPQGTEPSRLASWLSYDEGKTWPIRRVLHEGGAAYSKLVALPDRRVGVFSPKLIASNRENLVRLWPLPTDSPIYRCR